MRDLNRESAVVDIFARGKQVTNERRSRAFHDERLASFEERKERILGGALLYLRKQDTFEQYDCIWILDSVMVISMQVEIATQKNLSEPR